MSVGEGGSCLPVVLITTLLVYSLAMYSTYKHYGVGRGSKWGEVGAFFESSACPFFFCCAMQIYCFLLEINGEVSSIFTVFIRAV